MGLQKVLLHKQEVERAVLVRGVQEASSCRENRDFSFQSHSSQSRLLVGISYGFMVCDISSKN